LEDQNTNNNTNRQIYLPLFLAFALSLGFFLGARVSTPSSPASGLTNTSNRGFNKLNDILNYIEHEYVDSVDRNELEEIAIETLLQELDPHSVYIPPADLEAMNEPLEGNFDGIGIEFRIRKDTITVINPISGGPSEKLGIMAGDRIVRVDTQNVAGVGVTNSMVMRLLKGSKGTKVKVEIARHNHKKPLVFDITRDKIPIHSVDVAYMLDDETGFIKIARFAKTTYEEFMDASDKLKAKGMKKMVLDLRNNGGGLMRPAVKIADEFLPEGDMIVYTEGKARPREEYIASSHSSFVDLPLVVLIDEGSASASEIVSGALQDNDRGTIIGRRSFGKGLVQEPSSWPDGSAVRLTIARYYTPTGRCIQKPYNNGVKAYYENYYERVQENAFSLDSIDFPDSLKFTTPKGKTVYGGGGITPDVFIPIDTVGSSYYFTELVYMGIFRQFSFEYADKRREELLALSNVSNFVVTPELLDEFVGYGTLKGIRFLEKEYQRSKYLISNRLKATIVMHIWKNEGFYPVIHENDNAVKSALEVLQ
jgi:carboxyl-terminal processing protease